MPATAQQIKDGTRKYLQTNYPNDADNLYKFLFGYGDYPGFINKAALESRAGKVTAAQISDDLAASVTSDACQSALYPMIKERVGITDAGDSSVQEVSSGMVNRVFTKSADGATVRSWTAGQRQQIAPCPRTAHSLLGYC